jgi:ORF6N domain-containing protein
MTPTKVMVQAAKIEQRILLIRGEKVIIYADLAGFYGVPTKRLNEQVKRNKERFPKDFMFQLSKEEWEDFQSLRSQNATLKRGQHRKYLPYVFTEHGEEIQTKGNNE